MSANGNVRAGVIAGGNWIIDHVKIVDSWPPQDSLANITSETQGNGGGPYNVLKNLSKLGATFPLEAIGLIGYDSNGALIVDDCRKHGISTSQLRKTHFAATSYTDVITVRETGRRTFFHQRGANRLLGPEHFDFTRTKARIFHLGYLLLLDELDRLENGRPRACEVLGRARAAGMLTSLDCVSENSDRFQAVVRPALPDVDILFANDTEAEKLTGIPLRKDGVIQFGEVEQAGLKLLAYGVRRYVVLHFPEAAYAVDPNGKGLWQASLEVPESEIKGLAGAGDAFASGVLYGQYFDWSMRDSLKLGASTAASSLLDATCSGGVLNAMECMRLDERWKFRVAPK